MFAASIPNLSLSDTTQNDRICTCDVCKHKNGPVTQFLLLLLTQLHTRMLPSYHKTAIGDLPTLSGQIRICLGDIPVNFFEFLSNEFAACSKPPSRNNYRKESYPFIKGRIKRYINIIEQALSCWV